MRPRLVLATALLPAALGLLAGALLAAGVLPTSVFDFRLLIGADVFAAGLGLVLTGLALLIWISWQGQERRLRKRVERERRVQIESRQRFVSRLNHELKNPLTAMQAALANLEEGNQQGGSLKSVRRQVDRLSRLVGELQKLAQLESREIEYEPVDLPEIIEVADTGCGIIGEDLPHVTEELYRGRDAGRTEGSGLGLALVERVVALHGGEMTIRSREGEGTVVTLRLPLVR